MALFFVSMLLLFAAVPADASAFLQKSQGREDNLITREQVVKTIAARSKSLLGRLELELRPMFLALPKDKDGNLESATVRYALHRYFMSKHGWHVSGLSPTAWKASNSSWNAASMVKDRAPAYIQSIFEEDLHGKGMGLHELAVFAAAMSDLVHNEVSSDMLKVFSGLRLPTTGSLPRIWSDKAVRAYVLFYLLEGDMKYASLENIQTLEKAIPDIYPAWHDTVSWADDFRHFHDFSEQYNRNPFRKYQDTFDTTVDYVKELGHNFGSYQRLECTALKQQLVDMEHMGTGRVLLSRFYQGGLQGDWTFTEPVDYLRNLGALDESDAQKPSVIIPNYITSKTNCLTGSGFYSVCCSDECEGLLSRLERSIASSRAEPQRIAALVSSMPSDTVEAPRNLSSAVLNRLDEIAAVHNGEVPLHSRLMAQWMHHVYPRECPYPHAAGAVSPLSPKEWLKNAGAAEATVEQMQTHFDRFEQESESTLDIPWSSVEELPWETKIASWSLPSLRSFMAVAAFASFAGPLASALLKSDSVASPKPGKTESMMV